MAYKRRYRKYKRRYRRTQKRSRSSPLHAVELKTVDYPADTSQGLQFTSSGNVILLNGVAEGPASYERIGRKVSMKSIDLHFTVRTLTQALAAGISCTRARILIVYDRSTQGAAPSASDILTTVDSAGTQTTTPYSGLNPYNMSRFRVVYDNELTLPACDSDGDIFNNVFSYTTGVMDMNKSGTLSGRAYIKLKGRETCYNGSTAGVGDIISGGLFLLVIGEVAGAVSVPYSVRFSSRLRYYD